MKRTMLALVLCSAIAWTAAPAAGQSGTLLIVGGGSQPPELVQRFVDLSGGTRARIAVIPLASGAPKESGEEKVAQFVDEYGAEAFVLNPLRHEAERGSDGGLDGVTGVWFTGGDQARITEVLAGTRLLEQIRALHRSGAAIGGTSAGAAIMSDSMLTGNQTRGDSTGYYGDEFETIAYRTIEVVPGLGFLPGTIVDQHFVARERHNRLMSAVLERPTLIGVGIDESTAIEVAPDGRWTVRGASQAIVYDAREAEVMPAHAHAGAAGIRLHVLPPGAVFDPASGAVVLPLPVASPNQENAQ